MTEPEDPNLDDFLAADDELSRDWHAASNETPPPALDADIRRAARRPIRRPRWQAPLAAAAVVILGMGLLFEAQNTSRSDAGAPQPTASPAQYDARRDIGGATAPQQPGATTKTPDGQTSMKQAPAADRIAPAPSPAQESAQVERQPAPERLDASAWLAHIRALQENGHRASAAESLQAFRRRYPEHEVPVDLRLLFEPRP